MRKEKRKEKSTNLKLTRDKEERKALLVLSNDETKLVHSLDYFSLKTLKRLVERRLEELSRDHFRINEYLSLKLEDETTNIYVDGEKFKQCKYLLLDIPEKEIKKTNKYRSIDEVAEIYSRDHERDKSIIKPEMEFTGHCSNLQAWYELDYDTTILHSNLALPLLHKLYQAGEPKAKRVFKEQLVNRLKLGEPKVTYTIIDKYLKNFSREELDAILYDIESTFVQLMIKLLCFDVNDFGIPSSAIKYTGEVIEISANVIQIAPHEDSKRQQEIPKQYEKAPLYSLRQRFTELSNTSTKIIPLKGSESYTFKTNLILERHLSTIEKLLGDTAKASVLYPTELIKGQEEGHLTEETPPHSLYIYHEEKDIDIILKCCTFAYLIVEPPQDVFKGAIKKAPKELPRFMQLAFMLKILGHTIEIIYKYKFKVSTPSKPHTIAINLTISKYGHIHRSNGYTKYDSHKTMPYEIFKKRIKSRLNNNLIEFGIKGYKKWRNGYPKSKEDISPDKIGTCFYKYNEFKTALKCFKDKSAIEVTYPSGILAKNYYLCLSSKKEDIEVELHIDRII